MDFNIINFIDIHRFQVNIHYILLIIYLIIN